MPASETSLEETSIPFAWTRTVPPGAGTDMHMTTQLSIGRTAELTGVVQLFVGVTATVEYPPCCPRRKLLVPCMMRPPVFPAFRIRDITHAVYGAYDTTCGHLIQDAAVPYKYGNVAVDPF